MNRAYLAVGLLILFYAGFVQEGSQRGNIS